MLGPPGSGKKQDIPQRTAVDPAAPLFGESPWQREPQVVAWVNGSDGRERNRVRCRRYEGNISLGSHRQAAILRLRFESRGMPGIALLIPPRSNHNAENQLAASESR